MVSVSSTLKRTFGLCYGKRWGSFWAWKHIRHLVDRYLSVQILQSNLVDLPSQFQDPHQRRWDPIRWKAVNPRQIRGINPEIFLAMIVTASEVEDPIRGYAHESWTYLDPVHPKMAHFMGGSSGSAGVWEKEERRHAPVLRKLYQQLTGDSPTQIIPNSVNPVASTADPRQAAHHHILGRVNTEWSAVSVYLWLMAHSSGELCQVLAQLLQDEINHLAKFWGFRRWAFGSSCRDQFIFSVNRLVELFHGHRVERSQGSTLLKKLNWIQGWPNMLALGYCFTLTAFAIWQWDHQIQTRDLDSLFK